MKQDEVKLQRTAYHEAGHAVACYLFGIRFKSTEICKKPDNGLPSGIDGRIEIGKSKNPVHDHIFMLLAGPATESIFCDGGYFEVLLKNQRDVELAMSFDPSMDFRAFYDYVREAIKDRDVSRMVGAVGGGLLSCGKLSSREVKEVCESVSKVS